MAAITILLVEDENIEALDIKRTLESFGYHVPHVASYGEEAIEKAREIMPDIVLMDIVLKGEFNGIDAALAIKELAIPVIYLTAHSEESTIERAKLTEPYGYLIKPFDPIILKNTIELALFKHEMEQKLKEIVYGSPIPQFVLDKNHRVIYWNKALEKHSGIKSDEVIGTTNHWKAFYNEKRPCMADLLLDDSSGSLSQWYSGKFKTSELLDEAYEATDFFPKLGNGGKWLYFTATTIKNSRGEIIGALETLEDVTARKVAEMELKKSESRYRNILENMQDAYLQSDKNGKITMVSPSAAKMYRYDSPEDMIGIPSISLYKKPEHRTSVLEKLEKHGMVWDFEGEGLKKDGTSFWASMNAQVFYDDQGQVQGLESFIRDISERKLAENKINKLYRLYATLSQINQAVVRIKDRDELFKTICRVCIEFGKFQMVWIGLIDSKTGTIQPIEHCGHEEGYLEKINLNAHDEPSSGHPSIRAINKGDYVIIENIEKELNRSWREETLKRNYHSFAAIPLKLKGEVIALLNIYSSEADFFTDEEVDLIKEMALDISFALDSLELQKEREEFEKALLESERNYRELVDPSMVAIYKTTLNGDIIFANESMARMFHYNDIEDLKRVNIKNFYKKPEDRDIFLSELQKNGVVTDYEVETVGKDGQVINVLLSASLTNDVLTGMFMDITARKNAENALKRNEANYRFLTEQMNDIVWTQDLDLFTTYVSPSIEKVLGFTPEERKKQAVYEQLTPESMMFVKELLEKQLELEKTGESDPNRTIKIELEYYHKDGSTRWLENVMSAIRNEKGELVGLHGVSRDITHRKDSEEALRQSEERFRALIFNSTDLIRILDKDGLIIFDSPSSQRILGYPKGFFLGKSPLDFIHPDDVSRVKNDLEEVYEDRNPGIPTEFRILKADGEYISVETVSQNLIDVPGVEGIVVTTHPIQVRKEMEEALRESEEKYRTLFESDPDYTVLVGLDGVILDINTATVNFTGIPKEKLIGANFTGLDLFPEEDAALQLENFILAVKTQDVQAFQCRIFNKEGEYSWIESKMVPIEKDGEIHSVLVIATDITQRKMATDSLEASLEEKEVLLKEIHHRVKNNMQIISSLISLQSQHVDNEEALDVLKESKNRVRSMAMIHEKLYQSNDFTSIQFADYIERLVSELFYSYQVNRELIKPVMKVGDIVLNIETAIPCGLIISELISNSLKHAFPQGNEGEVIISLQPVDTNGDEGKYELIVSDSGIGFPEDLDFRDTGSLGLQLVNTLVHQIDGEIELDNSNGTEFKIIFQALEYPERF